MSKQEITLGDLLQRGDCMLVMETSKGKSVTLDVRRSKKPTLEEAQKAVGGFIEIPRDDDLCQLVVNEEGLILDLPENPAASIIAGCEIRGNAMLLAGKARME